MVLDPNSSSSNSSQEPKEPVNALVTSARPFKTAISGQTPGPVFLPNSFRTSFPTRQDRIRYISIYSQVRRTIN